MPNTGVAAPGYPAVSLFDPVSGAAVTNGSGAIQTVPGGTGTGLTANAASANAAVAVTSTSVKSSPGRVFYVNVTATYTGNPLLTDGNGGTTVYVIPSAVGSYAVSGVFNTGIYFNVNSATGGTATIGYS
jgi:hypothetical protein